MPVNSDFDKAAVWSVNIPKVENADDCFLSVSYAGDCARIYADGKLVEDNFWNGKPMLARMSALKGKTIELRILPLAKDAPIYLQSEQRKELESADGSLMNLKAVTLIRRVTE